MLGRKGVLGVIGHWISSYVPLDIPGIVGVSMGLAGSCAGLFFLVWSVTAFWFVGRGTPVPIVSPTKLVTGGPFKYTRNPIKLGTTLFYFGTGALFDGMVTGLVMFFGRECLEIKPIQA